MISKTRECVDNKWLRLSVHVEFKNSFVQEAAIKPPQTINHVFERLTQLSDIMGVEFMTHLIEVMGIGRRDC